MLTKKKYLKGQDYVATTEGQAEEREKVVIKKLQIVDEDSKSRPFAVMINNNHAAWPVCGVQDAYIVYEIWRWGWNYVWLEKEKDS